MNGLLEILTNKQWMIRPEFVHSILPTVMSNLNAHSTLGIEREKKSPSFAFQDGTTFEPKEYQVTEDGSVVAARGEWGEDLLSKMKEPFVNVMPIDGPITRNGGACSYGSRDIRDWMMRAADNKFCKGHILNINTPGGSAWAKNDFQQGIEYAHERGQRVYAFIDGMCASAGMYLASLCDEVYVMNLNDELGCVGVMAAFYTEKAGEKNQFTNETYREYYATKSINKNKEFRDIANDDDATLLIADLDKLEAEFRANMKAAFPEATDEYLDGKIYPASEVVGILCDGQMMLGELTQRVFDVANGAAKPLGRKEDVAAGKAGKAGKAAMASQQTGQQAQQTGQQAQQTAQADTAGNVLTPNNNKIMKEKFPALFAALMVEEMQMQEEGAFMNMGLLETLNAHIEKQNGELAEAKALAEQLTADKQALEQQVADLNAQMETANGEHAAAIEEKDNQIATLEQEKADMVSAAEEKDGKMAQLQADADGAKASLETATATIAERDQTIADLNAQVEELKNDTGEGDPAGQSPASNGAGAEAMEPAVSCYVFDPNLSYEENMKRKAEFESQK